MLVLWGVGVLAFGILFVGIGVGMARRPDKGLSERADGVVEGIEPRRTAGAGPGYFLVLRFTTVQHQEVTTTTRTGRSPAAADVGESVTVAYDPRDPGRADVIGGRGATAHRVFAGLLVAVGLVAVLIGAAVLLL